MTGIWEEFSGRGAGAFAGLVAGSVITWAVSRWKRMQQHRSILEGDARDTVVIHHHVIETDPAGGSPPVLRIRTLGQSELDRVVPNGHLAHILLQRAFEVEAHDTLICMEGKEGSFLLETLTGFVCDRTANGPFEHDLFVMAPCCEPQELSEHQPITIVLISAGDLSRFDSWDHCRDMQVEHGSDGARILTLMDLARRYRSEQEQIRSLRAAGRRTLHTETMYVLDLALDRRTAKLPTKPVPWSRFEKVMKKMKIA